MQTFTVIVLRPDYIANPSYGQDFSMIYVSSEDDKSVPDMARNKIHEMDARNGKTSNPEDYAVLAVIPGMVHSVYSDF